jgi:hypothetical protein
MRRGAARKTRRGSPCQCTPPPAGSRIEAATEAAGQRLAPPYETRIAADPSRGGVRVLITGPQGFERTVAFVRDEAAAAMTQRVRETIDD